jgi:hypothetical protein
MVGLTGPVLSPAAYGGIEGMCPQTLTFPEGAERQLTRYSVSRSAARKREDHKAPEFYERLSRAAGFVDITLLARSGGEGQEGAGLVGEDSTAVFCNECQQGSH